MVQRTTVVIPEELKRQAKRAAAERGVSMGELIREALEEKLRSSQRPPLRIIGIAESRRGDLSRRSADERAVPRSWR